jgi:hypothetical protein
VTRPVREDTPREALEQGPHGRWFGVGFCVGTGLPATVAGVSDMPIIGTFLAAPLLVPPLACLALGPCVPGVGFLMAGLALVYVVYVAAWTGMAADPVLLSVRREPPYAVSYVLTMALASRPEHGGLRRGTVGLVRAVGLPGVPVGAVVRVFPRRRVRCPRVRPPQHMGATRS